VDVEDGTLWACQMVKSKRQSSFSKRWYYHPGCSKGMGPQLTYLTRPGIDAAAWQL
jgi:hypothetical protein